MRATDHQISTPAKEVILENFGQRYVKKFTLQRGFSFFVTTANGITHDDHLRCLRDVLRFIARKDLNALPL